MFEAGQHYFIDSNVFLYAAGEHSFFKDASIGVLKRLAEAKGIAVTNVLCLEEVHYVYYQQTRNQAETVNLINDIKIGVGDVFPITLDELGMALGLFRKSRLPVTSIKDYYHVATMINNAVRSIISFDSDFDKFKDIHRIDPSI